MATAQKKNAGGKRTASGTGRTASGSRAAGSRKKAPAPRPIRREVGAVACLLLAIFSAFGYFHIQAIFIDFFCGLVKGLIGYGYWHARLGKGDLTETLSAETDKAVNG